MGMEWYDYTTYALLVIGGLNWGLSAFLGINLVFLLARATANFVGQIVYGAITLSALYGAFMLFKILDD